MAGIKSEHTVTIISYREKPAFEVTQFLWEKGFGAIEEDGKEIRMANKDRKKIGILNKGFGDGNSFIGLIDFTNEKKWIFSVYGKNRMKEFGKLSSEMTLRFFVDIILFLEDEKEKSIPK